MKSDLLATVEDCVRYRRARPIPCWSAVVESMEIEMRAGVQGRPVPGPALEVDQGLAQFLHFKMWQDRKRQIPEEETDSRLLSTYIESRVIYTRPNGRPRGLPKASMTGRLVKTMRQEKTLNLKLAQHGF